MRARHPLLLESMLRLLADACRREKQRNSGMRKMSGLFVERPRQPSRGLIRLLEIGNMSRNRGLYI